MSPLPAPSSPAEMAEAVRSQPRVLAVGARTKPRLCQPGEPTQLLSTSRLSGMVEYEPEEFTLTALAGTPIREIAATLERRGQYLPFDPMLLAAGSTLGGTIAAGLSGPGRLRFGGVRDFILGVRFVDGSGRILRMGGKVVKNAAGFDFPKFLVGSLGRFGILIDATFKVFPAPPARLTLKLATDDASRACQLITQLAKGRWEPEALDYLPDKEAVFVRLSGPGTALPELADALLARHAGKVLQAAEEESLWNETREFSWAHRDGVLIKLITTPAQLPELLVAISLADEPRLHVSGGGNVAYVSFPSDAAASAARSRLAAMNPRGLTLRGNAPLWWGELTQPKVNQAVKQALDPTGRFPALDD